VKIERLPHPAYSPDLSPCDFWLFGMLKGNMKDRAFQTVEEIFDVITLIWNGVRFEQLQSVFLNWIERLEWVISNGGEYYIT
jgi:histone-lysine N-methyltransferase SETMAR